MIIDAPPIFRAGALGDVRQFADAYLHMLTLCHMYVILTQCAAVAKVTMAERLGFVFRHFSWCR